MSARPVRHVEAKPSVEQEEIPWSQVDADTRKDQLGKLFVERDITGEVFKMIDSARADRRRYAEPQNVVIVGETGVGKSEIAKRYLAANPERIDPETGCIIRPVLYVDVRNSSTPKSVAQAMLRQLLHRGGIEDPTAPDDEFEGDQPIDEEKDKGAYVFGGTPELTYRVKKQMVAQKVEVAILDEFHNTVTDNGAIRLNRIAEWVKDFAKTKTRNARNPDGKADENVVIVMMGTRKVNNIIDPTVNAELASITPYRIGIDRYRYQTAPQKAEFRQFLDDLDLELPFDEDSKLGEPDIADKMHIATFGLLRQVAHIVTKAAELAIDDGAGRIREHHLHQAIEIKRGVLEAVMMSEESTKAERRPVENPFKAPPAAAQPKERKRSGYRG